MANITENTQNPAWSNSIYQIETSDPVLGGANGIANRQAKELAARTQWLKTELAKAVSSIGTNKSSADSAIALKANHATQITAGAGLTGGGDLSANRTIGLATPSTLSGSTTNWVGNGATGHTHEIAKATPTLAGVVKLVNAINSTATDAALTAAQGKVLADQIAAAVSGLAAKTRFARPIVLSGSTAVELNLTSKASILKFLGNDYIGSGYHQIVLHNTSANHVITGLPLANKAAIQLDICLMGGYSYIECHYLADKRTFRTQINWNVEQQTLAWQENLNQNNGVMLTDNQTIVGVKTFSNNINADGGVNIKGTDAGHFEIKRGTTDFYLRNRISGKSLRLLDNGTLDYSADLILLASMKSDAVNLADSNKVATAIAAKTAHDKAVAAENLAKTKANLADFAVLKSANGYQKLPNGVILQWGQANAGKNGTSIRTTFPVSFPAVVASIQAVHIGADVGVNIVVDHNLIDLTGFSLKSNYVSHDVRVYWFAIGY